MNMMPAMVQRSGKAQALWPGILQLPLLQVRAGKGAALPPPSLRLQSPSWRVRRRLSLSLRLTVPTLMLPLLHVRSHQQFLLATTLQRTSGKLNFIDRNNRHLFQKSCLLADLDSQKPSIYPLNYLRLFEKPSPPRRLRFIHKSPLGIVLGARHFSSLSTLTRQRMFQGGLSPVLCKTSTVTFNLPQLVKTSSVWIKYCPRILPIPWNFYLHHPPWKSVYTIGNCRTFSNDLKLRPDKSLHTTHNKTDHVFFVPGNNRKLLQNSYPFDRSNNIGYFSTVHRQHFPDFFKILEPKNCAYKIHRRFVSIVLTYPRPGEFMFVPRIPHDPVGRSMSSLWTRNGGGLPVPRVDKNSSSRDRGRRLFTSVPVDSPRVPPVLMETAAEEQLSTVAQDKPKISSSNHLGCRIGKLFVYFAKDCQRMPPVLWDRRICRQFCSSAQKNTRSASKTETSLVTHKSSDNQLPRVNATRVRLSPYFKKLPSMSFLKFLNRIESPKYLARSTPVAFNTQTFRQAIHSKYSKLSFVLLNADAGTRFFSTLKECKTAEIIMNWDDNQQRQILFQSIHAWNRVPFGYHRTFTHQTPPMNKQKKNQGELYSDLDSNTNKKDEDVKECVCICKTVNSKEKVDSKEIEAANSKKTESADSKKKEKRGSERRRKKKSKSSKESKDEAKEDELPLCKDVQVQSEASEQEFKEAPKVPYPVIGMERWTKKVALVTGANSGIGLATCQTLACQGMCVVGVDKKSDKMEELERDLVKNNSPGAVTARICDVSVDEQVLDTFKYVRELYGGADVVVCCAGLAVPGSLIDGDPCDWRYVMDINLIATALFAKEFIKDAIARSSQQGQIIFISCILGHKVIPYDDLHFCTVSKHGVNALTEAFRQELVSRNLPIRISQISPGFTATHFFTNMYEGKPPKNDKLITQYPESSLLIAEDIANAILYVLSAPQHVQIHEVMLRPKGQDI